MQVNMSLFQIDQAIEEVLSLVDPETGELTEEVEAKLDQLEVLRSQKIVNIGLYYKNLTSFAEACKAEEKAIAERRKQAERKALWLKAYLADTLQGEKVKTPALAITYRKSMAVEETKDFNLKELEKNFPALIKVTKSVNKTEAKNMLKNGIGIKGLKLVERNNLVIK